MLVDHECGSRMHLASQSITRTRTWLMISNANRTRGRATEKEGEVEEGEWERGRAAIPLQQGTRIIPAWGPAKRYSCLTLVTGYFAWKDAGGNWFLRNKTQMERVFCFDYVCVWVCGGACVRLSVIRAPEGRRFSSSDYRVTF